MREKYHSTPELVAMFEHRYPIHQVRRTLDAMGPAIPRIGLYRMCPARLVERVRLELERRYPVKPKAN